ncbi:ROK family protein [Pseudopedobacter saltans DSM 12145]|uniref:ROK family protein n=1 Tax=Pseudopedobacter saltans (strain ATCC 51119 / DSM 12145 / JCM 21818 / CCUG 39354 / LMG 10337 / NBRC 100064 / NCIMB 13643) TaxID=762903 RepID=F0S8C8_PSESL|nr:ROK family protein [Pseudopedobacter saltans]ADY53392.1 ROK family protein [Pseudopedobacter saltans DSM 12145]
MDKQQTLAIDIGGSSIKATVLDEQGEMLAEYQKTPTPKVPKPEAVLQSIKNLVVGFPEFNQVTVGFPGYVRAGIVQTAPNLGTKYWEGYPLAQSLADEFGQPVRLLNDADLQGFGLIEGKGLELVLTLGTGLGTALFMDGSLLPHLELSHFIAKDDKDFDAYIGDKALDKDGTEKWNKKLKEVIALFSLVVNYNKLYLSGGNAKKVELKLDHNIKICGNREGIKGGAFVWKAEENFSLKTVKPNTQHNK